LELGKATDHQVRANARSGFSNLTWMRFTVFPQGAKMALGMLN